MLQKSREYPQIGHRDVAKVGKNAVALSVTDTHVLPRRIKKKKKTATCSAKCPKAVSCHVKKKEKVTLRAIISLVLPSNYFFFLTKSGFEKRTVFFFFYTYAYRTMLVIAAGSVRRRSVDKRGADLSKRRQTVDATTFNVYF